MSSIRGCGHRSAAAEADSAPVALRRAAAAPAFERAAFARALHAAQRRDHGDIHQMQSDRAAESEGLCCEGEHVTALGSTVVGELLTNRARQMTLLVSPPPAGIRAPRPRAAAAQQAPQQDVSAQESPTTIEWQTPLLPSGRLTLRRTEGGAWTLCCQAADLEALRGAVAQLADRFEQRALGPLQVRVE
jgi:hypothetical protein